MIATKNNQQVILQKSCDEIIRSIRSSNLHFTTQETPFSLYITVRKKLINKQFDSVSENELLNYELLKLKEKCDVLCQNNDELSNILKMKDKENEIHKKSVYDLSQKLEKAKLEVQEAIAEIKDVKKKHDNLVQNTKKVNDDLTRIKSENDTIKMELKEAKKIVKSKEREDFRKSSKIDNLEEVVKNLKLKSKEATDKKNKLNKENIKLQNQMLKLKESKVSASKSTSTVPEYSAEASTSTMGISSESAQIITSAKMSQTDQHPEIPYNIDTPLPPIFSSSLVHRSKALFLSRSHPNLATIRWCEFTEDDVIEQEIEKIEIENYDQEIKTFYAEAAEKSRNLRQIYENQEIMKLFNES